MQTVYESSFARVTEEGGVFTLSAKSRPLLVMAGLALSASALVTLISRGWMADDGALGRLAAWCAAILASSGAALGLLAAAQRALRTCRLDCERGILRRGGTVHRLAEVSGLRLVHAPVGDRALFVVTADVAGKEIPLLSGWEEAPLANLVRQLSERIQAGGARPPSGASVPAPSPRVPWLLRRLPGMVLVGVGVVWSSTGAVFLQGVVVAAPGAAHGPLLWPLGLWIALLGGCELGGVPALRWLRSGTAWQRAVVGAIATGSYFCICWR